MIFRWDENLREVSRKDVFSQGPWCLHVCAGQKIMVTAVENAEILVQRTYNDRRFCGEAFMIRRMPPEIFLQRKIRKCGKSQGQYDF